MIVRTRTSYASSALRTLALVVPASLVGIGASIGIFALTGDLGAGIIALLVLWLGGLVLSLWAARRLDHRLDASNPPIRLEDGVLVLPPPVDQRLDTSELRFGVGWYNDRGFRSVSKTQARGVFLHLKWEGGEALVRAHDDLAGAPATDIERYKGPPDREMPEIRVWARDLVPLIERLRQS